MTDIFVYLLNHSIKITFVILLVLLVRVLFLKVFRLPGKYAYILWGIVALRMVLVFSVTAPFSIFNMSPDLSYGSVNVKEAMQIFSETVDSDEAVADGTVMNGEHLNGAGMTGDAVTGVAWNGENAEGAGVNEDTLNGTVNEQIMNGTAANGAVLTGEALDGSAATYIWLAGVLLLFSYMLISYYMTGKRVATAVLLSDNVYECDHIAGPFVFGLIKPAIYLPFGLEGENLSYILMHERYHIRRRDPWVKCIAFLLASIYWFNPLVWVAFYLAMSDMEMSVDEAVLLEMGNEVKQEYCMSLLAFASGNKSFLGRLGQGGSRMMVGPLAFGESGASKRIKNVLRFKKPGMLMICIGAIIIVLIAAICLTNGKGEDAGTAGSAPCAEINTYIPIEDTRLDHAFFTMTVPEDFVGKVSYAVLVEEPDALQEDEVPLDYRIEFVLDEIKFYGTTVPREEIIPSYGAGGTLGGIAWWTVEDLNWVATEEEIAQYDTFAAAYEDYWPDNAIGFEGRLLQSDPEGSGGYCEVNPTDVQWGVGVDDLDTYYESYLYYSAELKDARETFRSKAIADGATELSEGNFAAGAADATAEGNSTADIEDKSTESASGAESKKEVYEELVYSDQVYQAREDGIFLVNADGTEECLYEGYIGTSPGMVHYENRLFFRTDINYEPGDLDWNDNAICQLELSTKECSTVELKGFVQGKNLIESFYIREGFIGIKELNKSYKSYLLPEIYNYVYGVSLKDLEEVEGLQQQIGEEISAYLRENPGSKLPVAFLTAEHTFALLDLDGNSALEKIILRPDEEVLTFYREGRLPLDYFVLEVGDTVIRDMADNLSNGIWAFSPDGEKIVLMLYEDGPSDDPVTFF